jgi:hypothetical protein
MTSAVRQFAQTRDSQTQRHRSPLRERNGAGVIAAAPSVGGVAPALRGAAQSAIGSVLGRSGTPKSALSASPRSLFFVRSKCNDYNTNGLFSRDRVTHDNQGRPHASLGLGIPDPPARVLTNAINHRILAGHRVVAMPNLGGLHHEYRLEAEAASCGTQHGVFADHRVFAGLP